MDIHLRRRISLSKVFLGVQNCRVVITVTVALWVRLCFYHLGTFSWWPKFFSENCRARRLKLKESNAVSMTSSRKSDMTLESDLIERHCKIWARFFEQSSVPDGVGISRGLKVPVLSMFKIMRRRINVKTPPQIPLIQMTLNHEVPFFFSCFFSSFSSSSVVVFATKGLTITFVVFELFLGVEVVVWIIALFVTACEFFFASFAPGCISGRVWTLYLR